MVLKTEDRSGCFWMGSLWEMESVSITTYLSSAFHENNSFKSSKMFG